MKREWKKTYTVRITYLDGTADLIDVSDTYDDEPGRALALALTAQTVRDKASIVVSAEIEEMRER